ncbi:MAG TPA: hypothetical protein VMS31_20735, partial [Pyrinomonadaceae bacterium]|nr:hypothetical protein [Pyrinomonadaceae bacterium]
AAKSVATLLAASDHFISTRLQLLEKVKALFSKGPKTAFARLLGVSDRAIGGWKNGVLPSLDSVLKICNIAEMSLLNFMDATRSAAELQCLKVSHQQPTRVGQTYPRVDRAKIEALAARALREYPPVSLCHVARRIQESCRVNTGFMMLQRAAPSHAREIVIRYSRYKKTLRETRRRTLRQLAQSTREPPFSAFEIAQLLQVNSSSLKGLCPTSYSRILDRYAAYKVKMREEKEIAISEEIRSAAYRLHNEGTYPSFPKVSASLRASSWLARESRRKVLRQIQLELGYRAAE